MEYASGCFVGAGVGAEDADHETKKPSEYQVLHETAGMV